LHRIAKDRLQAPCVVGEDEPVSLRFLIEDYLRRQRWRFDQLKNGLATP
jgi:predicted transcriptional regulator